MQCEAKRGETTPLVRWVMVAVLVWLGCAPAWAEEVKIVRFDRQLLQAIEANSQTAVDQLFVRYPKFAKVYAEGVVAQKRETILRFFAQAELRTLYTDAVTRFSDVAALERQLSVAFTRMKEMGWMDRLPEVYLHVSGLNQSIVVGDGFISISIDKYLGADYPFYRSYLYDYQRKQMEGEKIVSDCIRAWLYSEHPIRLRNETLLEYMLYEGRIMAISSVILPPTEWRRLIGYSAVDWEWATKHEKNVWRYLNQHKQLRHQDPAVIARYINEGPPSTFMLPGAPDRLGVYIGWRIVEAYMKNAGVKCTGELMGVESETILANSKYKP